jgi:hypothetical protein
VAQAVMACWIGGGAGKFLFHFPQLADYASPNWVIALAAESVAGYEANVRL